MRLFLSVMLLFLSSILGYSQEKLILEQEFITEFIKDNKEFVESLENSTLYVLGYGNSFIVDGIVVTYLSLEKVKGKVNNDGPFKMVRINDIYIENGVIKTSFNLLTALEDNDRADFSTFHDSVYKYCMIYNCQLEKFEIYQCGN